MSDPGLRPLSRQHPLHGRNLRHAALVVFHRHGSASISEILDVLWANDFRLTGTRVEMGKRLSDALRHETKLGRAQRVGWGRYAIKRLANSTRYRLLRRWQDAEPAIRDEHGEPVLDGRSPDDWVAAVPWSVHDRHGDQLWLRCARPRWTIGKRVLSVRVGREALGRIAAAADTASGPRPPSPTRRIHLERRIPLLLALIYAGRTPPAA